MAKKAEMKKKGTTKSKPQEGENGLVTFSYQEMIIFFVDVNFFLSNYGNSALWGIYSRYTQSLCI